MQKDSASGKSIPGQRAARSRQSGGGDDGPFSLKRMPAMMHAIDARGEVVDVSDLWLEKMGYRREEVLGRKSVEFLTPDSRRRALENYLPDFFASGAVREVAYQFVRKDGDLMEVLLSASSEYDSDGTFRRSLAVLMDVTDRNRLMAQREESKGRYRSLIRQMTAGFAIHEIICDARGCPSDYRFLEVNPAFEQLTGLAAEEVVGKTVLEVLPETESFWIESFGKVALSRQPIHFEHFSRALQRHFEVLAYSPFERKFAVVFTDISDRKKIEAELSHSERLFRRTFDQAPIGAAIVGFDHKFLQVNRELCRITGYVREELLAKSFPDITHADDLQQDLKQAKALEEGRIDQYQMDKRYIRKDGRPIWVRLSVRLIRDKAGRPLYHLPMIEDIDRRKHLEEEQRVQIDLLRLLNKDADLEGMIASVLEFLKDWIGIDGIGIRIRQNDDVSLFRTRGLPDAYWREDGRLCDLDRIPGNLQGSGIAWPPACLCRQVIENRLAVPVPFVTAKGSFLANSINVFLAEAGAAGLPPDACRRCCEAGFESMLLVPLGVRGNTIGLLQLNHKGRDRFPPEFVALVERLADPIAVALAQCVAEERLKNKQLELEETNAALKVLIRDREEELRAHDRSLVANIRQLVMPGIQRLKLGALSESQRTQLTIIENHLQHIASPFAQRLAAPEIALTPALIQVADLIRNGFSTKEIAAQLGVSVQTVATYRKRIRDRLNLKHAKTNLRSYLLSLK